MASLSALVAAAAAHGSSFAEASEDGQATPGLPSAATAKEGPPNSAYTVEYPDGFETWAWVKAGPSGAIEGQPAGTHHIYANPAALEGFRTGRFADGAVLVFDVIEGTQTGAPTPAEAAKGRLRINAMVRDEARYASTGGWGYAEWLEAPAFDTASGGGTGRRVNAVIAANPNGICHTCHIRLASDRSFVVSRPGG